MTHKKRRRKALKAARAVKAAASSAVDSATGRVKSTGRARRSAAKHDRNGAAREALVASAGAGALDSSASSDKPALEKALVEAAAASTEGASIDEEQIVADAAARYRSAALNQNV